MLSTFDAIEQRRSVKYYDPTHEMSEAEVQQLLEVALLSPTSFNMQNWRFLWVKNNDLKAAICQASWGQAQVKDCSLLLVLCADLKAFDASRNNTRYWAESDEKTQSVMVGMMQQFYENNPSLQRDEALRSIGIVSQTLMLAAKAIGYDSCPMVGFDAQKVGELIHLPKDYVIGMLLPIGKALQPARPRGGQLSLADVLSVDTF